MQNRYCKIITISLIIFLLVSIIPVKAFAYGSVDYENFSKYKSKYRILYGIILVALGGALTYDGFRNVKVDISRPEVKIDAQSRWFMSISDPETEEESEYRDFEAIGTITNTGNVALRQITFEVRYRSQHPNRYFPDEVGEPVTFNNTSSIINVSEVGQTDEWEHHNTWSYRVAGNNPLGEIEGGWYPETYPYHEMVEVLNIHYSYDKKYKEEMNNVYEGVAGVLLVGAGIYLLVDYIVGLKKFDYYMKKHNLNFYVQNDYEEFQFILSKRI